MLRYDTRLAVAGAPHVLQVPSQIHRACHTSTASSQTSPPRARLQIAEQHPNRERGSDKACVRMHEGATWVRMSALQRGRARRLTGGCSLPPTWGWLVWAKPDR
jgi:hypothetical protein